MVLALAAAIALGLWQLGVWRGHRAAAEHTLVHAKPVALSSVMGGDSPFPGSSIGQPVRFTGSWLPKGTVYVSDQRYDGRRGYWVVTPVLVGRSAMPVVRGWVATPRAVLPRGSIGVTGWLEPSQDAGRADTNPNDDIITSMRIPSMTQHVATDLYSGYVVASNHAAQTALQPLGPTAQPDVSGFTGLRNLLYAFQWWIFGGFAVFIWGRWCRDQLHPPTDAPVPSTA